MSAATEFIEQKAPRRKTRNNFFLPAEFHNCSGLKIFFEKREKLLEKERMVLAGWQADWWRRFQFVLDWFLSSYLVRRSKSQEKMRRHSLRKSLLVQNKTKKLNE